MGLAVILVGLLMLAFFAYILYRILGLFPGIPEGLRVIIMLIIVFIILVIFFGHIGLLPQGFGRLG